MVKFGETLQNLTVSEWKEHYVKYKVRRKASSCIFVLCLNKYVASYEQNMKCAGAEDNFERHVAFRR